jgi:hypothetical protein
MSAMAVLLLLSSCGEEIERRPADQSEPTPTDSRPSIFVDAAESAGLTFVHFNGMSGEHYFNEMMGGGAALIDYDNDGDLDVYLVQGHMLGRGKTTADAWLPPHHPEPLTDRLYRNDLQRGTDGSRVLRFTDMTEASGTLPAGYGMGVTTGDYDNDGWVDLYVTNFGSNQLLRNRGDGTFEDVTAATGTDDRRWSVAATFLDFDRDGWLDLYVGNYVDFSLASQTACLLPSGAQTYCSPGAYRPEPDSLFRNRGDGQFEDVSIRAGIRTEYGAGLGAVAADFNGDRWIDLYVANDQMPNQLWINRQDGSFSNEALMAGVAVNQDGQPEASMGVDALDFDADGDVDLVMTHIDQESNTVYVNDGSGLFEDASFRTGLGLPSLIYTGFGTGWFDYDNDGWLDLLVVNGAVIDLEPLIRAGDPYPLHQINQLFRNLGTGKFEEITSQAGKVFELSEVSRGAAFGDVDNDGDTDVVVVNNNGPVRLLLNQVGQDRPWMGLRAVGRGRDMLGAEVIVSRPDGPLLSRRVHTDGSYASASDPRVLIGLGQESSVSRVEVRWPDGGVEEWDGLNVGEYTTLRQGDGRPVGNP